MKDIVCADYHNTDVQVDKGMPYPVAVTVTFTDGSMETYTSPEDLAAVQQKIFQQQRGYKA